MGTSKVKLFHLKDNSDKIMQTQWFFFNFTQKQLVSLKIVRNKKVLLLNFLLQKIMSILYL